MNTQHGMVSGQQEGKGKGKADEKKNQIKRHNWSKSDDNCLLNLLKEQKLFGGKEGTGFSKKAWKDILAKFNSSKNLQLELQQIKNRHKHYRRCFNIMDKLMNHTGFGWNDDTKVIDASDDKWTELIEKDPSISNYRDKVWPNWHDLLELCSNSTASGFAKSSSKKKGAIWTEVDDVEDLDGQETPNEYNHVDSQTIPNEPFMATPDILIGGGSQQANGTPNEDSNKRRASMIISKKRSSKKQRRPANDALESFDKLAEASSNIYEMKQKMVEKAESYSVRCCFDLLKAMGVNDPGLKLKAAKAFANDRQRELFIEMDEELRDYWLADL